MAILSYFVLLCAFAGATATEQGLPLVPMSVQVFRDSVVGTSIANISRTCLSKRGHFLMCQFHNPLHHVGAFSVQPDGILKTNYILGCIPYLNNASHLVIVVPFYCSNKTRFIAVCLAKVHIEILEPVNSAHLKTICSYGNAEPVDATQKSSRLYSLPSQVTPDNYATEPSTLSPMNSSYKRFSVEISAAIGGGSTVIIFLTASMVFRGWLHFRRHKQMDNGSSTGHSAPLGDNNRDQLRVMENGVSETIAMARIVSNANVTSVKVVVDLSEVPTDVFHKEARIAKGGALAETLKGLQSDSASSIVRGRQKFKQIQQWLSEQQELRGKQRTSPTVVSYQEETLNGSLVNINSATSVTILPEQTVNKDFTIIPDLEDQGITTPPPEIEYSSK